MIKFMDSNTALTAFHSAHSVWQKSSGIKPAPISRQVALAEWMKVKEWAKRSPTALNIIRKVESSKAICHVICYRGTGSTIFAADEPQEGQSSVHWDLAARYVTNGRTQPFHHYIALLHEFGHFIQWNEDKLFYRGNPIMHSHGSILQGARQLYEKAAESQGLTQFIQKRKYTEDRMFGVKPIQGKSWSVRLEMDNLRRHEWPICDEMGVARRLSYSDFATL